MTARSESALETGVDPRAVLGWTVRHPPLVIDGELAALFPEGGLVRGRVVDCRGPVAISLATALVAAATRSGTWVAIVGLGWIGIEHLVESGVDLDHVLLVDTTAVAPRIWAERVIGVVDGCEIVITSVPSGADERLLRSIRHRLQARGAVMIAVDTDDAVGYRSSVGDLMLSTVTRAWCGPRYGAGHLQARHVEITVSGRRVPRSSTSAWWLPGPDGRIAPADVPGSGIAGGADTGDGA